MAERRASDERMPAADFGELGLLAGGMSLSASLFGDRDPFKEFSADPFEGDPRSGLRYSCQTFAQSSVVGPEGEVHTERFASSDVGDRALGVRESQQAYANSASDVVKTGVERHSGGRAVKVSRVIDRETNEERQREELFRGVEPETREAFDRDYEELAKRMPKRPRGGRALLERGAGWSDSVPEPPLALGGQ
mmetsp:Transcript_53756/g.155079  ORF Transcript_53756/g.155079 Transcript_53756/m.155079 type:complete len:193 (+) Transcript_53756:104-682(+)